MGEPIENTCFRLPAVVLFGVAIGVFSFVAAVNPLGVLGLPLSIGAGALLTLLALSRSSSQSALAFVLVLPAFVLALTILRSPALALAALFPAVLAYPIYITVRAGQGRTVTITAAALAATAFWLLYFGLSIYIEYGSLNAATIQQTLDDAFAPIRTTLSELTYEQNGETYPYYPENTIDTMIYQVKTLLLGSLAAIMVVIAYVTTLTVRIVANIFDVSALLPKGTRIHMRAVITPDGPTVEITKEKVQWYIQLDNVTAFVFIAAYFVSVLLSDAEGSMLPAAATADNLIVILLPGFVYVGVREIVLGFRDGTSTARIGCSVILLSVVLMFVNPMSVFLLLAVVGVASTIRENKRRQAANKQRKE
ncbi:MAG: hypothetical protein IJ493_03255 [Clostridia bacterium]|nr:hypothetical protein [Clostridia bacterium]